MASEFTRQSPRWSFRIPFSFPAKSSGLSSSSRLFFPLRLWLASGTGPFGCLFVGSRDNAAWSGSGCSGGTAARFRPAAQQHLAGRPRAKRTDESVERAAAAASALGVVGPCRVRGPGSNNPLRSPPGALYSYTAEGAPRSLCPAVAWRGWLAGWARARLVLRAPFPARHDQNDPLLVNCSGRCVVNQPVCVAS